MRGFHGSKNPDLHPKRPKNGPRLDPSCHFKTKTGTHIKPQKCRPSKDECTLVKKAPKVIEAIFGENVFESSDWLMS